MTEARKWFRQNFKDDTNKIYTSKYYRPEESWPKTEVWWLQFPLKAIDINKYDYVNFICQVGIISPNDVEPQDIILSFAAVQGKYIKTLPLHDTQQILVDNDEEMKIKLKLCVTHDLLMELLSFGDNMKVIEPKSLGKQIKQAHEKTFRQY